jgi:Uncharacterized protein conserved in cyanobacteria
MNTREKRPATIEDLYKIDGKAELVNGRIVRFAPMGGGPGSAKGAIYISLRQYERESGRGLAFPGSVAFIVHLPNRESFSPDAAFYSGPHAGMSFLEGAPIFAVEARSEGDYVPAAQRKMAAKRADYFAAGTQVVWDVDLMSPDVVRVYRASDPNTPDIFRRGEEAEAEPVLPGWRFRVDELFE